MGKLKLTKQNKRKKGASGIPNWLLTTIIVVVIVAVLATCVVTLISSTGLVMRCSLAMGTEDYRVSGSMMTYYYMNTYNSFLSTNQSLLSSLSLGGSVPISEHRNITVGGTEENPNSSDALVCGDFEGTWFDFFMSETRDAVKAMLLYCEEADERQVSLDAEDKKEIDDSIDAMISQFRLQYGYTGVSESACLNAMYGEGISKGDIRKAMQLSALATKCQEDIYEEINGAITDEKINEVYSGNKQKYDLVDYFYYVFDITYDDVAKEKLGTGYTSAQLAQKKAEVDAAYKQKIEELRAITAELGKSETLDGFRGFVYNYVAEDAYKGIYDGLNLADGVAPDAEALNTIKLKQIEAVVTEALAKATTAKDDVVTATADGTTTYTLYGISVKKEFADAAKSIKEQLFNSVASVDKAYFIERAEYTDTDDFIKWAFGADRKAGEIKNIEEGGDTEELTSAARYRSKVYFLIKPQYKDEEKTRDVAYMLFEDETSAKKAIEKLAALGDKLSKDTFEDVAEETDAAANTVYEDYIRGSMDSTTFDDWLYGESTKIGSYTATAVKMSDGSYIVAYYVGEGEPSWKMTVKNHILTESFNTFEDKMTTSHSSKVAQSVWTMDRIGK